MPAIVSGEALVAIVLSLPTIGPLLLNGLQQQDMFLASSVIRIVVVNPFVTVTAGARSVQAGQSCEPPFTRSTCPEN